MSDNNLKEIWQLALEQIRQEYISQNQENVFKLWFNMEYIEDDINSIKVAVPNNFLWDSMKQKGNVEKIRTLIMNYAALNDLEIIPVIKNEAIYKETKVEKKEEIGIKEETEIQENKQIEKEFFKDILQDSNNELKISSPQKKYTFDNFISGEGSSTQFAYKVALSVAKNPGLKANPLLFYGGVGLGKTHLMKAIGNKISELFPEKKICYIQAESFLNEFTAAMLNKKGKDSMDSFKSKYRKLDVLLLDDIQFFQNKPGIQEELFYTFVALHDQNSQMVFACDRPLKEIENMADRLVSRLGSGMCLDLQPPNYETRRAIIYKNLDIQNKTLPEDVINLIASVIETNIRDLEAAILKITNYAEFLDDNISVEIAKEQLQDFYSAPNIGNISIENIMKVVANNYNITVADIKSKKRDKKISDPRHIALYIAKELTEYTFTELGNECGGRDHSSIMHAVDKVKEKCNTDPNFNQMINVLIKEVKQFKNN